MTVKNKWLAELARDLIALGGIPFLILTIARVSVSPAYYPLQFIISAALFFILRQILRATLHAGIGLILLVFTCLYYNHLLFTIFALIVYVGLIISLFYLKNDIKEILKGILLGAVSAGIGYLIVKLIFF